MKFIFLILLVSLSAYAQYSEVEFTEGELDFSPVVKDLGFPPKEAGSLNVTDNNRSPAKESVDRAPAVLKDSENTAGVAR
jgi:hypothetical protein